MLTVDFSNDTEHHPVSLWQLSFLFMYLFPKLNCDYFSSTTVTESACYNCKFSQKSNLVAQVISLVRI